MTPIHNTFKYLSIYYDAKSKCMRMSSYSDEIFSFQKNGVEGEVVDLKNKKEL